MVLSFGLLYRGMENGKHLISNVIVLALVVLTHIYTSMLLFFASSFFIFYKKMSGLKYLVRLGVLSFLLVAFWLVPFVFKYGYSAAPKELLNQVDASLVFIQHFTILYFLALLSVVLGLRERDMRIVYICFTILIAFLLFMFANKFIHVLYIRFLPFLYFFPLLLAADGIGRISSKLKFRTLIPLIVLLIVVVWLIKSVSFIPSWIKWNYEGLEGKTTWNEFKAVLDEISKLKECGRIVVEYSAAYDKYGSPRVFEVSPVFTNKSVMEGLLLESSLTFPFYFYMQKEIAETTWWPGFQIKYPDFNLTSGAEHLELYNVKYYLVSSEKVKGEIKNNANYVFLKSVDGFDFYELNYDSRYSEVSESEPILVVTDDWRPVSYEWFSSSYSSVPLAFVSNPDSYDLSHFRILVLNKTIEVPQDKLIFYNIADAMKESKSVDQNCKIEERVKEEEISISTDCINKPLIIKIPYFPNWQVSGAKKIYLISPNLMLVFPEKNEVRLKYDNTLVDTVSTLLSLIGIIFIIFYYLKTLRGRSE